MIGYMIEQEFRNIVKGKEIVTIVTQIRVDAEDPSFLRPTKPIGRRYTKSETEKIKNDWTWGIDEATVKGENEEMYRRLVASPEPKEILEISAIRKLIESDTVVITCGGGGIPVIKNKDGSVHGVEAVIDKDKAGALLATSLNADALIMLTDVEFVYLDWKDPQKRRALKTITPEELSQYSFAEGSMGPKVFAAADFVRKGEFNINFFFFQTIFFLLKQGGRWAAIGSLEKLTEIMDGTSGTRVIESESRKNAVYTPYDVATLPNSWSFFFFFYF
jgi:carbamate kinase